MKPTPLPASSPSHPPPEAPGWSDWLFSRLSRITTSGRFIPEVDGLRFVAIGLVFLLHLRHYVVYSRPGLYDPVPPLDGTETNPCIRVVNQGAVGVLLFFVISGFILALPFAEHRLRGGKAVSVGGFYLRRLTRLEPPYLVSLALLFPLTVWFSARSPGVVETGLSTLASAFYLHGSVYGVKSPVSFVTWSLEIEVQFYLLVPPLAGVFAVPGRWPRRATVVALAAGLMALQSVLRFDDHPRLALSVLNYGQYFLGGFLLADLYLSGWADNRQQSLGWDVVWVVGWVVALGVWTSPPPTWVLPPLFTALFAAGLRGRVTGWCLRCQWVVVVGGMCYSIYLIHMAILSAAGRYTMRLARGEFASDYAVQIVLLGTVTLIASAAYFVLIERPCMRRDWTRRVWQAVTRRPRPSRPDGGGTMRHDPGGGPTGGRSESR